MKSIFGKISINIIEEFLSNDTEFNERILKYDQSKTNNENFLNFGFRHRYHTCNIQP